MPRESKVRFDVHPSVVFQLGESLISDPIQALIELVKNSYDADASYAKVIINTGPDVESAGIEYSAENGQIVIEDDGHGMDASAVEAGWLMISNRSKRELKEARKTTPGGRTPLGDKGLGRLGVQRLGDNLEIITKVSNEETGHHLAFSWLDFHTAPSMQDVNISLGPINYRRTQGTKIVITGLKEPDLWRGKKSVEQLRGQLSEMISPYKKIRDFMVLVEVDGKKLNLVEITDKFRETSPIQYELNFDGNTLTVNGRAKLGFFAQDKSKEKVSEFSLLVESDGGEALFQYLAKQKHADAFSLAKSINNKWFVEFSFQRKFDTIDHLEFVPDKSELANPGPFTGEIHSYSLGNMAFARQSIFDTIAEYKQHVKTLSGIKVYRDGFSIRVDRDWLKLGAQWSSAASYYTLKPETTLGYIALSARQNMQLEETTDREGFKDTPYYRNFYSILRVFVKQTDILHEYFRRSVNDYVKNLNAEMAKVDVAQPIEFVARKIKDTLTVAAKHHTVLVATREKLVATLERSRSIAEKVRSEEVLKPSLHKELMATLGQLEPLIKDAEASLPLIESYLQEMVQLKGTSQVLEDRVDSLKRQLYDIYETVALGLTAEALSHEVFNISDNLSVRAKTVRKKLVDSYTKNNENLIFLSFIEHVVSAAASLRKQIAYLSPSLKYIRESREVLDLRTNLEEFVDFYSDKLRRNNIVAKITGDVQGVLVLKMNKGKLTQIFDNIVLNAEYWLKDCIAKKDIDSGVIHIEIHKPFLVIWDNGRGVDQSVEYNLFEPFVSGKNQGRGLGLFIVKQLLDSEGCTIGLVPERNKYGNLYKFLIDFRGAHDD